MKATDLQIGDWVQNTLGFMAQVLDVHYIRKDSDGSGGYYRLNIGTIDWGVCQWLTEEDIQPIPLTQEILEKNKFRDGGYFGELALGLYRICCDCARVAIIHCGETIMDIPVEYVHQLQHALKLCGIDKEIII